MHAFDCWNVDFDFSIALPNLSVARTTLSMVSSQSDALPLTLISEWIFERVGRWTCFRYSLYLLTWTVDVEKCCVIGCFLVFLNVRDVIYIQIVLPTSTYTLKLDFHDNALLFLDQLEIEIGFTVMSEAKCGIVQYVSVRANVDSVWERIGAQERNLSRTGWLEKIK